MRVTKTPARLKVASTAAGSASKNLAKHLLPATNAPGIAVAKSRAVVAASEVRASVPARGFSREDKRIQNLVAYAIMNGQRLEAAPVPSLPLVSDYRERERLGDQMLQDSRDASFYLEECALHMLAGRNGLAQQAAAIWQRIKIRINESREKLTAVAPPPEQETLSRYWLRDGGVTWTFSADWGAAPSSEAELHLYRWVQLEGTRSAGTDTPVWKPVKGALSLSAYLKRAFPLLPEALAAIAARLEPGAEAAAPVLEPVPVLRLRGE